MCLILFSYRQDPRYPFVVIANRDEFFDRPSLSAHFWEEAPSVFAGRDQLAGGTWLGVSTSGRFAAITNYRSDETDQQAPLSRNNGAGKKGPKNKKSEDKKSRGDLTADFLKGTAKPMDYLQSVRERSADYNGFNLLVGDNDQLAFFSSQQNTPSLLPPGLYGLSNDTLDTPWPKVAKGKAELHQALQLPPSTERLLPILRDTNLAEDHELPFTGISRDKEKKLSARFIHFQGYGTRTSTLLWQSGQSTINLWEYNYDQEGSIKETIAKEIAIKSK